MREEAENTTSTLVESERKWAPVTLAFATVCPALGALALAYSLALDPTRTVSPLWVASTCGCALLTFSNLQFVMSHPHALTIGTIPIAIASAAIAAAPVALQGEGATAILASARVLVTLGAALALLFGAWFLRLRRASTRPDALEADCVLIVLGAAVRNGRPSETLKRRLDLAASLLAGHPARRAILTGGAVHPADAGTGALTEADVMRDYLLERDVPSSQLTLEHKAANTRQNIENSLALAEKTDSFEAAPESPDGRACGAATTHPATARKRRQLCVVSNDYHLYRAIRCGRELGADLVGCGARTPLRSRPQQWCREVLTILAGR